MPFVFGVLLFVVVRTIKATLDALKAHPLTDRYGRTLPSLTMDKDGWFEELDRCVVKYQCVVKSVCSKVSVCSHVSACSRVSVCSKVSV